MYRPEPQNPAARRPRLVVILLGSFFAFQLLLFVAFRSAPPPKLASTAAATSSPVPEPPPSRGPEDSGCGGGLVYVYELPAVFNEDLLAMCDTLMPMYSVWPLPRQRRARVPGGRDQLVGDPAGRASWAVALLRPVRARAHRPPPPALAPVPHHRPGAGPGVLRAVLRGAGRRAPPVVGERHGRRPGQGLRRAALVAPRAAVLQAVQWLDHFLALGRITWDFRRSPSGGWGGSFLAMPGVANVTRLVIEREPWDAMDVGIPYPTGFHPRTAADARAWQQYVTSVPRPRLFAFAGAPRSAIKGDFRALLLNDCQAAGAECGALDCAEGKCIKDNGLVLELFMGARFCVQPRGDSFTRRSLFDCMVAGAVPVLFWRRTAYLQYHWYLPTEDGQEGEWSVFIDRDELRAGNVTVRGVLAAIPEERVRKMRERVVEMIPRLVYSAADKDGLGGGMKDAMDVMIDGMLRRVAEQRRNWKRT
ncbi:hypothetical protein D1007_52049 [Hordeum vulgare]|nr:hypothetical protein D1007_52049 [Hordeum vulgare]